ncbi:general substrate transporter [Hyaloscypha bicolor E]|uniref:General substrate transporter n=1 Tax=Hyaloscypha bicolor E TaxID=1095630 RepID=A0A2J6TX42_9HELO|nr:general substrate transporter [Hyaloscypha bicolor E]PMD67600.1 general substrate transporter [Hyaloscypha bicolor E]
MAIGFFKNYRVYMLTTVAYMGSLLFGYDTGVMSSVLSLKSFKTDFGLPLATTGFASKTNAHISQNVVSLLTAGCFFGAIFASVANDKLGRKRSLLGFTVVFLVGAVIQVTSLHHISQVYVGRFVAGLGIGGMSSITPIYVAENCPPEVRGRITGLFQEFLVIGSTFAYWLNYGVSLHLKPSTSQWRIPVGIQIVPGGLLFLGLIFLKESPRWLVKQGRYEEATASLAYMRREPIDDPEVMKEIADIRAAVEEELNLTEGVTWKEVLIPGNRYRFAVAFTIFLCQQFSGTNSIGYYAPQIFQTVGVSKTNASLFATGVYGTVKVCATGLFLIIGIDKLGRRWSLLGGAAWMMVMMFIIGGVLKDHPPTNVNTVSPASIAMVVMIYLYVIGYSASWGPIPWVYVSEIFPTRLRSYGVGLAAATQWLFNFAVTYMTPSAINHIGWRIFLMFGIFCAANFVFVWFFIKETKGRTLEDMEILFGTVEADVRAADVERMLHKGAMQEDRIEMAAPAEKKVAPAQETPVRDAPATEEKTVS